MSMQANEMAIGALAKALDISTATINFYVKQGILPPPRKINRTRAAYSDQHMRLLQVIRRMQGYGYTLSQIKKHIEFFGSDEAGLQKLEGIGSLQPVAPVRNDPGRQPIEPFEPVSREQFLGKPDVSENLVDQLEAWGVLRPRNPGAYDAKDLWLVRTVQSFVDDGIPLEWLEYNRRVLPLAKEMSLVLTELTRLYMEPLKSRDMRFRELWTPLTGVLEYVLDRVHNEEQPNWRDQMFTSEASDG